ncbi:thioredoxin domain-containing protein [Sphingomonas sinipercae]|uniref:Thioredoxin domain-containing protein n=1 Tax=Sphingomonas sinipercae TaxID=2714944 RepID=A0A6G7ZLJ6_9SPHN|nr:thioredoxin domain-containing protein [Sphingomonas sinipercae]QIL01790.1 thioredoxin domain-containing protein [Sphingomonas sinipercae]
MKRISILLIGAAALSLAGCNDDKAGGNAATGSAQSGPVEKVARPADGDWSQAVAATHEGGFVMGNPDAKVKLVEFGSMTCPHCRDFDENGVPKLIDTYVKTGQVSFEFRNYVRDPYDIAAALIARCNGAKSFFPLTRGLYKDQEDWFMKLQKMPADQQQALQTLPPEKQFAAIADAAGFPAWAAMRGVPSAKSSQCLADQNAINKLVQMNSDATQQYNVPGTPAFVINGELVPDAAAWNTLKPAIDKALQ